ncbi:MAG: molybdopterin-dependent oxidoreductase [Hyphomicrobiaceae bacterium]
MANMSDGWTRTTCPYCGVGCGVLARPLPDGTAEIEGDPDHPANFGRLCSKGMALGETLSLADRLLQPIVDGRAATWNTALDTIARRFSETIADYGPESVALYVSGQILNEDYYAANKLMKGYIGTANIDTNSRLCMASSVAGHKRAFGADTVPGTYDDLEIADLVVLVGSNLAWCHPVLFQRLAAAREAKGTRVVVVDPRRTATCEIADMHLAVKPGSDVALFNGLLAHLVKRGHVDQRFVTEHTNGFDAALTIARAMPLSAITERTGLTQAQIASFYDLFARNARTVTVYSQGVNQSSAGTDKVNAIINCHLATARIGKPGMGPFSVTGQPNAMGGREVGGLANMLAAHMDLDNAGHREIVQRFWNSPRIASRPGLKAVDMFDAVADGRIKALWIMSTNPVVSVPDADAVKRALATCPFVVVSDITANTDTAVFADVLLPAAAWGEKDGTVTNSERRISRQRAVLDAPGEARPDWRHIAEVAKRMGFANGFGYADASDIFREYAALTGARNGGTRDLDISAFASLTRDDYASLRPTQWPAPQKTGENAAIGKAAPDSRFFADGRFFTPDHRARFVPTPYRAPASATSAAFPLVLNTGRIRDQWHTMTRSGKTPRLVTHYAEPFVEVHPEDAIALGLRAAMIAEITSPRGSMLARTIVTDRQQRGSVFAPMHWTDQLATRARVDSLVAGNVDPVSGQPEMKFTPVAVAPFKARWYAFAVTNLRPEIAAYDYAAFAPARGGFRIEIADAGQDRDFAALAQTLLIGAADGGVPLELMSYSDTATGQHRFAAFDGARCSGLLYVARSPVAVSRSWAIEQLGASIEGGDRQDLLAGRPGGTKKDRGAVVCSCFDVGRTEIITAIVDQGCATVAAVGDCVKAGSNCGSCRSEIARLIAEAHIAQAG